MTKVSPPPQWATKHRKPGTELRFIRGKYYLYAVGSVYDPVTKKGKKITGKILGSITEANGFVESAMRVLNRKADNPVDFSTIAVKEQGFSSFINLHFQQQINKLKTYFSDDWQQIIAINLSSIIKTKPIG
jgi:hypothetical protein